MFNGDSYRDELKRRIDTIRRMLDAGDSLQQPVGAIDVSREIRGLSILLLFASYENLLTTLCRGLLERATRLRVGNRRLRTGLRQFAVHSFFQSISSSSEKQIWQRVGRELLDTAFDARRCTIDTNKFPSDGSFMKTSQIQLILDIFELGDPGIILKEVWPRIDTIVTDRNKIAHGSATPEEVGRNYTSTEIRDLVSKWETRWLEVIDHVEQKASVREFYRY